MQDKIKVTEVSKTECLVSINIPFEEVDKKFDQFFESIKNKVQVPGFRKGKAPINRLKTMFMEQARPSVSQSLIGEYYTKMLQENEINPVGSPVFKDLDSKSKYAGKFGFDNSFSVELSIEIIPKIDPHGYHNIKFEVPELNDQDLFDKKLTEYREQFSERKQVTDRGCELGDTIVIDFSGHINGIKFDGGTSNNYTINKLGKANFIPGFESQLVGMKIGDKKGLNIKFPDKYGVKDLAGKDVVFDVILHSIVETKLADVNDDLALMVGFESINDLNSHINEEVLKENKNKFKQIADAEITKRLLEINEFNAPKLLVDGETKRLASRINVKDLPENVMQQLSKNAEYNVKRAIIMDAIYNKEKELEISPEDLNNLLEQNAKENNKTKDELVSALYNSGQMDGFVGLLRTAKVIDFIINNSNKE